MSMSARGAIKQPSWICVFHEEVAFFHEEHIFYIRALLVVRYISTRGAADYHGRTSRSTGGLHMDTS